MYLQAKTTQM